MFSYARRDLLRNPRRTLASLVGVLLGVGLFSGVLFFIDGSGASMTKRALAPVDIDMQRVLTSPLGEGIRLRQKLVPDTPLKPGEKATMNLVLTNSGATAVNEVVVNDKLGPGLTYVPGSARRDGRPMTDSSGQSPFAHGPGLIGLNAGTVEPGGRIDFSYAVKVTRSINDPAKLESGATVSTREDVIPDPANGPALIGPGELEKTIARIPGVSAANQLSFAQLAPLSLSSSGKTIDRAVKIFGFDANYAREYPAVRVAEGGFEPGSVLLSSEAARALGVRIGDQVDLQLPGSRPPASLRVSGITDLSRARPLFNSREGSKLEDFLYIPDSVVMEPRDFERLVIPAFRDAGAARGNSLAVKAPPTIEVDVQLDRNPLDSDPGTALAQTGKSAKGIKRVAPGQDYLLDNASNTLEVAKADAAVAKRMFLFLGLPGLLLAGFLAAYAGTILAASQRREQANLRLRGANRGHLTRILAYRTIALAGIGSILGTALGFGSILLVLGPSELLQASTGQLALSALIAILAGIIATGLALYLPGRRALAREVSGERREMALEVQPRWRRLRLDYAAVLIATVAAVVALRRGGFDSPSGAVSTGTSTSLSSYLLLLPLGTWFAGTLVSARIFEGVARHIPVTSPSRFGPVVRGVLSRTLSRRSRALITGITGVALVIGFGVGLATFASTYDSSKAADAEFTVGSNIRVTPSPLSPVSYPPGYARRLEVDGVPSATPVVGSLENSFLRSRFNSDVKDLAAIEPASFRKTAALSDQFFPSATADQAMQALATSPKNILLDDVSADDLKLEVGDTAELLLARGTSRQQLRKVKVAGVFTSFPGFPAGLNVVANLDWYQSETGIKRADFFLVKTSDPGAGGLQSARSAIEAGPGAQGKLNFDTTETSFNKDQSSLTALNVRGLVDLNFFFTLAISAAVIAIFVFGLMLQRRREYVVLRAQGLGSRGSGRWFSARPRSSASAACSLVRWSAPPSDCCWSTCSNRSSSCLRSASCLMPTQPCSRGWCWPQPLPPRVSPC
ncbi:MAG: ABC transporter permease [Solirubrobacterales bacterium]|nr:ABC transporter permease [Solirubrobacterales bacterium]